MDPVDVPVGAAEKVRDLTRQIDQLQNERQQYINGLADALEVNGDHTYVVSEGAFMPPEEMDES